ncbi:MAG: 2-aminoethylphosphonate aminotransferase [Gammaproteobacteria bacterium]|nr:2-aminoethylphosphonate aminotransferase [Gammaproteobacteria bacterium]MCP5202364.1 2-aminoethylphosphonate aminotransferase [Gammaproteobacteria bacterium]
MRTILLNPGPVTLSARVRAALTGPDLCHREVEFLDLQDRLRRKLREVYARDDTTWGAVLLTGSGTAAVEAMVASCVPRDGRLLVVENGVYGERMRRIAAAHGIDCASVQAAWGEAIDLAGVRAALGTGGYSHVAVVHHETTTGRLNDLAPLADACREHGARLLLDTVSSFGAEAIDFDAWPIDACAATANKCLHGVPGTAFVIARRAALAALEQPRTVYLDLAEYLARQDGRGTPFTQSVQTFYALDAALDEFFEAGGWRARQALFRQRMAAIRAHLERLGVRPLLPAGESSCVLEAYELPAGRTYAELHAALKARGFVIYAGQGALSERVFRISAMGDIGADDLERLLAACGEILG